MRFSNTYIFVFFLMTGTSATCYGGGADHKLELAQSAYNAGNYTEAYEAWSMLYNEGYADPDILINMGHALAMIGRVPEARMAYEKALRFCPEDQVLKQVIKQLHTRVENRVDPAEEFFLIRWLRAFVVILRPSIWALLSLMLLMAGVAGWAASLHAKLPVPQIIRQRFGFMLMAGALLFCISILSYRTIYRLDEGVILKDCEVYQGPSAQSPLLRAVSAGEKVKIKDDLSGWRKVQLLNFDEGWLKQECMEVIDPRSVR